MFDAGQQAVSPPFHPFLVDAERCSEDGCLVDVDTGDAHCTIHTETLEGRQHCHGSHGEDNDVGDGSDLQEEEGDEGNIAILTLCQSSYRDGYSCLLHCHRHDVQVRRGLSVLTLDDITVTLDNDEHVINPDPHKQEGDDGVHRTEDEPQAGADAVAGDETEKTAGEAN